MNNVRIQIVNQLYDEIEVKLKDAINEKCYFIVIIFYMFLFYQLYQILSFFV